jgi:hypothetical protein
MNQYRLFIFSFILSIIAMIVFFASYFSGIMNILRMSAHHSEMNDPFLFFNTIFSPVFFISLAIGGLTGLAYRIIGIVFVARNKSLPGGEQALWIVGFVLFGFITAIVFMVMGKGRNANPDAVNSTYKDIHP